MWEPKTMLTMHLTNVVSPFLLQCRKHPDNVEKQIYQHAYKRIQTYTHKKHVLHCLGLSWTLCHWSRRLHFGLCGLCVGSLSLELKPLCRPLTPGTSQSVYQCLQKKKTNMNLSKPILKGDVWRYSTFFLLSTNSNEKTKAKNELILLVSIVCISKT